MPKSGPVAWKGDCVEIVDQTKLPDEVALLRLTNVREVIDSIKRLAVRGAPAIGACGAMGVLLGLDEARPRSTGEALTALESVGSQITSARPTAVNLGWAVRRVHEAASVGQSVKDIRERATLEMEKIVEEDREACRRIGEFGRVELTGATTVLTHCNTGRLATLGWGTALGVVYAKSAASEPVQVFACETRPLLQGARLTAWELADAGIDVILIPDSAASPLLASGRIDAVVVGADRIAANGDTANKIGTLSLALAARYADVPFYVAAPASTFDFATASGSEIVIEERDGDEVRSWRGHSVAPAATSVWNPAFDVTPYELVTAYITENGVVPSPVTPSHHPSSTERDMTVNDRTPDTVASSVAGSGTQRLRALTLARDGYYNKEE